jgi:hypothetical protein
MIYFQCGIHVLNSSDTHDAGRHRLLNSEGLWQTLRTRLMRASGAQLYEVFVSTSDEPHIVMSMLCLCV